MILRNPLAEPRIPRPPLPACRGSGSHMAEPLQLDKRPGPTGGQLSVLTLRQAPGRADQVCQARLSARNPVLIHPVAITDEDTGPVVDEGGKGLFRSTGMNHVERCRVTHHHPQPLECMRQKPGCLINVVDQRAARLRGNRGVVRLDGLGHSVEDLLNGPQADGHAQRAPGLYSSAHSPDTSLDATPNESLPSRSVVAQAPDACSTASSGQMSCCHMNTARVAAHGPSWERKAPGDGPDG